jgi:hypothetical protein
MSTLRTAMVNWSWYVLLVIPGTSNPNLFWLLGTLLVATVTKSLGRSRYDKYVDYTYVDYTYVARRCKQDIEERIHTLRFLAAVT